jgi:succinyl-diaminopimelate desuccinylase
LIRCRSVTPAEGGALDYLQELLEPRGFVCKRLHFADSDTPDVQNLYARLGTREPHLCFAGHSDVVPPGNEQHWSVPPFAGEVRDGALYGRGAVDMKGAIGAFLEALFAYLDAHDGKVPGSVSLLITGDEEGPAINGTQKMLRWAAEHGERLSHCIVGEPTNPNVLGEMMKVGRRGSLSGTLTVRGRQGHVAYPHLADNPIPKMARLVSHLSSQPLDEGSDHFQPSSLQFTSIDVGNVATNVIPASAKACFNIRFNDKWNEASLFKWLCAELDAAGGDETEYSLDIDPNVSEAFLTGPCDLTDLLAKAIYEVTGRKAELSTSGGTSDARFIKDYCPVIEFGLVGQTMHQIDEFVRLEDLGALAAIYRIVIGSYFERFGKEAGA